MEIDVVFVVVLSPEGFLYPSYYVQGGGKVTRKVAELVTT
jgi:hypothetical protein